MATYGEIERTVSADRKVDPLGVCIPAPMLISKLMEKLSAMRKLAITMTASFGAFLLPVHAFAYGGCESGHWIESVSDEGEIIKLEDDSIWEVSAYDAVDSALWLPASSIVACGGKLINTDDNESVNATRLR